MTSRTRAGLSQRGFTLIELVIIIVILGIIAAVAVPRFTNITEGSKVNATKQELSNLKKAISGDPSVVSGGEYIDRGFEGDVGFVPTRLDDLAVKPDSIQPYDRLTRLGWNGPYIDGSNGDFTKDAWGNNYVYQPGLRRIFSIGNGIDSIKVTF